MRELITLYCVRYDPFYCEVDPERIWTLIQGSGGSCHAGAVQGSMDFYVPAAVISMVLLMDSGLKIIHKKSYI
jgi:hypothetical protein